MTEKKQIEYLEELMVQVDCDMSQFHHGVGRFASEVMRYIPGDEVLPFNKAVKVETWNRGYDFTAKGIMKRKSDDSIMIVGEYFGKEDSEFLSYVWGYKHDKAIFTALKDALLYPPIKEQQFKNELIALSVHELETSENYEHTRETGF